MPPLGNVASAITSVLLHEEFKKNNTGSRVRNPILLKIEIILNVDLNYGKLKRKLEKFWYYQKDEAIYKKIVNSYGNWDCYE
jgi:hypothetical protein